MAIVLSLILIFVGIGVLVLIRACIVGGTLRRGFSGNEANMVERGSLASTSLSREDIEKLPCFDFKGKEKGSSPSTGCVVCLENFRVGEKCRLLPSCNHSFHAECVDLWLLRTPICPICRANVDIMKTGTFSEESNGFRDSGIQFGDGLTTANEAAAEVAGQGANFDSPSADVEVRVDCCQESQTEGTWNSNVIEVRNSQETGN